MITTNAAFSIPTSFIHLSEDYHEFTLVKSILNKLGLMFNYSEVGTDHGQYVAFFWTGEKPVEQIIKFKEIYLK
jgi:hypothetical protein